MACCQPLAKHRALPVYSQAANSLQFGALFKIVVLFVLLYYVHSVAA